MAIYDRSVGYIFGSSMVGSGVAISVSGLSDIVQDIIEKDTSSLIDNVFVGLGAGFITYGTSIVLDALKN